MEINQESAREKKIKDMIILVVIIIFGIIIGYFFIEALIKSIF